MSKDSKEPDAVPWWRTDPWLGRHLFAANRLEFPPEELDRYVGQTVAWYPDGSGIRDAGPNEAALRARFQALGEDPEWYNFEDLSPVALMGGIFEESGPGPAPGTGLP